MHTDWRGLPNQLTDGKGKKVWEQRFDAWGNELGESKHRTLAVNHRLAGQYLDDETGLHYNIHRYLDSQAGRYISPDPLGTPDGPNRYAYLNGDPNKGIDPLGLFKVFPEKVHQGIMKSAFAEFNQKHNEATGKTAFSDAMIDYFISANFNTDADEESQFDYRNHFDNPHDTPAGYLYRYDGRRNWWIQDSIDLINERRDLYSAWGQVSKRGIATGMNCVAEISLVVKSFGMNTHALQDFYAHTNWIDPVDRGGSYLQQRAVARGTGAGGMANFVLETYEIGTVPIGMQRTAIWDETVIDAQYSGNAEGCATLACALPGATLPINTVYNHNVERGQDDIKGFTVSGKLITKNNDDKTTHAYWAKDHPREHSGALKPEDWNETLHQKAIGLAIKHTVAEIGRLYNGAGSDLKKIFEMDERTLKVKTRVNQAVKLSPYLNAKPTRITKPNIQK